MQVTSSLASVTAIMALVFGTIGLGGGIYETLLIDRAWPHNPIIIQPDRGGIDRKWFWGPVHALYEIALLGTAWVLWADSHTRSWIVVSLVAHFTSRVWSFAYFIPKALAFEKAGDLTEEQSLLARRWTRLSLYRVALEAVSILSLCAVILRFGMH